MLKNFFKFGKKKKDEDQKDTLENQIEKEIEESQSEIDKIKAETEKEIKQTAEEILGKNAKKTENNEKSFETETEKIEGTKTKKEAEEILQKLDAGVLTLPHGSGNDTVFDKAVRIIKEKK